jgi:hypothetical protein
MDLKVIRFSLSLVFQGVLLSALQAQEQVPPQVEQKADYMEFDQGIAGGAYRLIKNVEFKHEGALMYCDSAYFYKASNSLDAFSRVHINQADTMQLYGDFLHYNGNTRIAEVRRNVRLLGRNTELTTTALDFDLGRNIGYYTHHADIISGDNNLTSREGYYYSNQQMYYFRDSVVLRNPDYTMYSDTLRYNTNTKIAYFLGPTRIIGDSSFIYCEDGWYNTETDKSFLKKKALVMNKKQTVRGDSLYYERRTGYGEGFSNVELVDLEQNIILRGDRAFINQQEDRALLTDSALFIYITQEDSVYVHADTLKAAPDSAGNRQLRAYYGVKVYKSDLQGICDSLFYSTTDSILRLYHKPVLWSGLNQLSAEYIEIWTKNKLIDQLHMQQLAFIINEEDSGQFNQIKGKNMVGYFRNNELYKIVTLGNGQTVYYARDKNELIGVNIAQSSNLTIWLKNNKPDRITFNVSPTGTLYPLKTAPQDELILKDFKWLNDKRPKNREDIFSND